MNQLKSSIYFSLATAPFDLIFWHKNRHFPRPAESDPNAWAHLETIVLAYHSLLYCNKQTSEGRASSPVRESHTFDTAWCLLKQSSIVSMVMLVVALLVVLPAVLVALLMSGNTWKLNGSQLSPTTNNLLASVSHFFFFLLQREHFPLSASNLYFMKKTHWRALNPQGLVGTPPGFQIWKLDTARLQAWHCSASSSYWRLEATAVSSVTTNLQVGSSRVLEPNKPNDKLKALLNWI